MDTPPTPGRAAVTSAAGPAVNVGLLVVAIIAVRSTTSGTLPHLFAAQLAWTNGLLAAFNLLPGLPLDGGAILRAAVWKVTGRTRTATTVAAWGGRAVAVLAVLWFLRDVTSASAGSGSFGSLWTLFLAFWIWSASTAALNQERTLAVVPTLSARALARPVVRVAPDTPVAVMMQRMTQEGARGALVVDSAGRATGIVNEAAVSATPRDRWPWVSAGDVSRRLTPELGIDATLTGDALLRALAAQPASEYVVEDTAGAPIGVLSFADVNAALSRR